MERFECYLNDKFYGRGDLKYMKELFTDYVVNREMYGKDEVDFKIKKVKRLSSNSSKIEENFRLEVIGVLHNDYNLDIQLANDLFTKYEKPIKMLDSYLVAEDVAEHIFEYYNTDQSSEEWVNHLKWVYSWNEE